MMRLIDRILRLDEKPPTLPEWASDEPPLICQPVSGQLFHALLTRGLVLLLTIFGIAIAISFIDFSKDRDNFIEWFTWVNWDFTFRKQIFWFCVITILALPGWGLATFLKWQNRWYVIGDHAVRLRSGVLCAKEITATLANVQSVHVSQSPAQRLFGVSSLVIKTAGGSSTGHAKQSGAYAGLFAVLNVAMNFIPGLGGVSMGDFGGDGKKKTVSLLTLEGVPNAQSIFPKLLEDIRIDARRAHESEPAHRTAGSPSQVPLVTLLKDIHSEFKSLLAT